MFVERVGGEVGNHPEQPAPLHPQGPFPVVDLVPLHRPPAPLEAEAVAALASGHGAPVRSGAPHRDPVPHHFHLVDHVPALHPEGQLLGPLHDAAHGLAPRPELNIDPVSGDGRRTSRLKRLPQRLPGIGRGPHPRQPQPVSPRIPVVVVRTRGEPESLPQRQPVLDRVGVRSGPAAVHQHRVRPHVPLRAAVLREDLDQGRQCSIEAAPVHPLVVGGVVRHQHHRLLLVVRLQRLQRRRRDHLPPVLQVHHVHMAPLVGVPLVRQEGGEDARLVVGPGRADDLVPVRPHHRIPLKHPSVGVDAVRREGVEVQVGPGDLVAALKAALGIAQLVVIVDVSPPEPVVVAHGTIPSTGTAIAAASWWPLTGWENGRSARVLRIIWRLSGLGPNDMPLRGVTRTDVYRPHRESSSPATTALAGTGDGAPSAASVVDVAQDAPPRRWRKPDVLLRCLGFHVYQYILILTFL